MHDIVMQIDMEPFRKFIVDMQGLTASSANQCA